MEKKLEALNFGEEIVLKNNISLQKAHGLMRRNERYAFRLSFENRKLKARRVVPEVNLVATSLLNLLRPLPKLWSMGNVSCIVGNRCKEADMSLVPEHRTVKGQFLTQGFCTLVAEILFDKNQLLRSLRQWLSKSTSVNIAIGIKLGEEIWFYMFVRGQKNHVQVNLNKLQAGVDDVVKIPLKELYDGSRTPKPDTAYFNLNLKLLFDEIIKF